MKYLKWFGFLFVILLLLSCKGEDGTNGSNGKDPTSDVIISHNLSGKVQKGRCLEGGEVLVWPLDDGSMTQLGNHFIGTTKEGGAYNIRGEDLEDYALMYFKVDCGDEANGGMMYQELYGIRKVSDPIGNINPLTMLSMPVAESLFDDAFGDVGESLEEAERLTNEYLSMPGITSNFGLMSLENDGTADAILALTSSMILYGRTQSGEAADYMSKISTGIIENDLVLKAEILESYSQLPLMDIKKNLETSYLEIGVEIDTPPFWKLLDYPGYYADLLGRIPIVTGTYNLDDNTTCSFDQSTYNTFAVPYTFDASIDSSKYIAFNFPPDVEISVWTVGVDGNGKPAPGAKLLDITALREIILDTPVKLSYNGLLGDSHGITTGLYYLVIRKDDDFTLSKGCGGVRFYTEYTLASDDEGTIWIGDGNNADKFFYFSGVKSYTTN